MIRNVLAAGLVVVTTLGCTGSGGAQKVLYDFGIGEAPEGYVSGTEKVFEALPEVGATEMQRMNIEARRGEILFDDTDELHGKYYREVKVYERATPIDAAAIGRNSGNRDERGFVGQIEYRYRVYQGRREATRAEALASDAMIPTNERGSETYRYRFNSSSQWNGGKGERISR